MTSLYKISEQAIRILGKGEPQEIIELVKQAYATVAKNEFYQGKNDGCGELDGSFIYTFKNQIPIFDEDLQTWYINIPSTYLTLPYQMGVNQVSKMGGQDKPFVMMGTGSIGLFSGLKSAIMGGNDIYYIENSRMYLTTIDDACPILLKLAIALDQVDVFEDLNISPNIVDMIINNVLPKYQPKPVEITKNL